MPKPENTKDIENTSSKEDLKRKLKEKMMAKRINRMGKSQQKSIMNKHLEKVGIDPKLFMKQMQESKK